MMDASEKNVDLVAVLFFKEDFVMNLNPLDGTIIRGVNLPSPYCCCLISSEKWINIFAVYFST